MNTSYLLAILNLSIAFIGTTGNLFVLYASWVHRALKVDKVTLVFLESLAISDILMSAAFYLVGAIEVLAPGPRHRYLRYTGQLLSFSATYNETLVIAVLSLYRVWMLKKPPNMKRHIDTRLIYLTAIGLYFVGALVFLVRVMLCETTTSGAEGKQEEEGEGRCALNQTSFFEWGVGPGLAWVPVTVTLLLVLLPLLLTIAATAHIFRTFLGYDHKMSRKHERANRVVRLLLFVCSTFILSYLPLVAYSFLSLTSILRTQPGLARACELVLGTLPYFLAVNVISNPFLYVVISPQFRCYLSHCSEMIRSCFGLHSRTDSTVLSAMDGRAQPPIDSERHSTLGKSEDIVTHNRSS